MATTEDYAWKSDVVRATVVIVVMSIALALLDAVWPGTPTGFTLDLTDMKPGNVIHLTYTDTATNTQHQISLMNVNDPSVLPLLALFLLLRKKRGS